jgi:hypothetical protein
MTSFLIWNLGIVGYGWRPVEEERRVDLSVPKSR